MLKLKDFCSLLFVFLVAFQTVACADTKEKTIEQYRAEGYAQQQKGNFYEALTYFQKAVALGLENAAVWNDMGVLYEETGMPSRARNCYLRAIQADAKYLPAYMNLGYLNLRQGQRQEALEYFKKRYSMGNPEDPWTRKAGEEIVKIQPAARDWILSREARDLERETVRKAHEEFDARLRRGSKHYQKGEDLFKQNRYKESITEYHEALRWMPGNPKVLRAKRKAELELSKRSLKEHAEKAVRLLDSGNPSSARDEIREMLATIPNEPVLISR